MRAMINRIILLVLDGLGIGALPDASLYGDAECNTLANGVWARTSTRERTTSTLKLRMISR